ncbi:hypothetical protein FRC06_010699, partial [Ceratobasidium sp. 370]
MSTLSTSSPSATNTSLASKQTSADLKRCYYCPRAFLSSLERCQHIADTPACKAAREVVIRKAMKRERVERRQRATAKSNGNAQPGPSDAADPQVLTSKRRKVGEETVPSKDTPALMEKSTPSSGRKWPKPTVETVPEEGDTPVSTDPPVCHTPKPPVPPT